MESQRIFSQTISVLEKAMDLRSKKHNVIASNIANMDTPGYKAFDLVIEKELQKAAGKENSISLNKTNKSHMQSLRSKADGVSVVIDDSIGLSLRGDGNTVDIDKQMGNMAENTLMFKAAAQMIHKKFQGLKSAIQGGK
ncbi:MAG: flagellar basal-body rod protein FlgB [Desulfobacteraceae bacterium 4572_187]|nr:MAG: flagellar basal-body rod protein FlgB [Desulfobacteraceae bacterium 4572_187]